MVRWWDFILSKAGRLGSWSRTEQWCFPSSLAATGREDCSFGEGAVRSQVTEDGGKPGLRMEVRRGQGPMWPHRERTSLSTRTWGSTVRANAWKAVPGRLKEALSGLL